MSGNNSDFIDQKSDRRAKSDSYEDDGFFSDVPGSGSLSRSLVALNKYVKKNLLYEEEEYEDDRAYFSKESTPNDSVVKYDSDSTKSNDSSEKSLKSKSINNSNNKGKLNAVTPTITEIQNDQTYLSKQSSQNDLGVKYDSDSTKSYDSLENNAKPKSVNKSNNEKKLNIATPIHDATTEIRNPTEQTDDYKFKKLKNENLLTNNAVKKTILRIKYSDHDKSNTLPGGNKSNSLEDLSNDYGTPIDEDFETSVVVRRERNNNANASGNRHTVHEFSDWANRTNVYPDVYAPLPYKSPRRYVESDVNIHYRCPVRHDPLPLVPERELARQQAEHMKRLYREQRRNKYLQELQDMQNRRHQDNFTPSQKNILPLNRYDEAERVIAKALYTFNGQTSRELSFRKGEIIHVRRQIDANWYEGEIHGRIGLFPYNYVEIQKGDTVHVPKKPAVLEGRARAKFDFTAQTNLELPLKKGEIVILTRRIDQNWWEGRNAGKTGIFPDSYVTVLQEPSQNKPEPLTMLQNENLKPVASPAAHGLMNGTAKRSMGAHSYLPQQNNPALSNAPPATMPLPGYTSKPAAPSLTPSERGYGPPTGAGVDLNNTEPLYVDTNAEAVPYRAMYKYRPQNPDELELQEGDTVYVLEKCDDGWYVGSSQRTGRFGTFPGNYVERI